MNQAVEKNGGHLIKIYKFGKKISKLYFFKEILGTIKELIR